MELAQDFTDTMSKGLAAPFVKAAGITASLVGVAGKWFGAPRDNSVSLFGKMVEKYGKELTSERVIDQQRNIAAAIDNEDTFFGKAVAAVAAGVSNPLGLADWAVTELAQDFAPKIGRASCRERV